MVAHGTAAPAGAVAARALSEDGDDAGWVSLGRIGWAGHLQEFPRKGPGLSRWIDPNWQWAVVNSFDNFQTMIWVLKSRISNFKPKLNWGQTRINSNELFEYFSNLQLLKISFE
jgi:hypothetical protein